MKNSTKKGNSPVSKSTPGNKAATGKKATPIKKVVTKPTSAKLSSGKPKGPKNKDTKKTANSKVTSVEGTAAKTGTTKIAATAKGVGPIGSRSGKNASSNKDVKKETKTAAATQVTATPKTKPVVSKSPTTKSPVAKIAPLPAIARPIAARTVNAKPVATKKEQPPVPPKSNTNPEIVAKIRSAQEIKEKRKDLAQEPPKRTLSALTPEPPVVKGQDRIVLMVHDPYWLHAHWDITRQTVDRAKAALVEHWHSVKPILRLLKLDDSGTTDSSETIYRDIEIHGGVRNWYMDVDNPPSRFQIVMGYLTASGRFYELVRSNTVVTPTPGGKEASDDHWADIAKDAERIYAMSGGYGDETQRGELSEVFEDRLKRTMDIDVLSQFGSGAEGGLKRSRQFHFDVDAELIVFGSTHPDAHVTIGTEPVKVRNDGTFSIRLPFPDRRQVLPATAKSRDGVDEQTVVIAVERNTKVMEPLSMDGDEP
ncbi:MAG: DUF4912 domain-containing protein [Planctomycetes bacterium]|nr:DUF4912 domain-containing protein [Planctomycetota bacterium]